MSQIYKRGDTWWIDYFFNGRRIRESSKSTVKSVAKQLLHLREGEIAQGVIPSVYFKRTTFEDLEKLILEDYRDQGRKSLDRLNFSLNKLREFFFGYMAINITTGRVTKYKEKRRSEGVTDSTINLELAALKRMFKLGSICTPPKVARIPHIPMGKAGKPREGFFEDEDFLAVVKALPMHLKFLAIFAHRSGWRKLHVMRLKWEQVDFEFGIVHPDPEHSKIKKCGSAPMDSMLRKILTIQKQRWERSGKRCDWVFPNENGTDRNKDFRKAWQSACERAGIGKRHFHDLRRTAVRV